jgi:general secretion pathway protein D
VQAFGLILLMSLGGCAQWTGDDAQRWLMTGYYEKAMAEVRDGLRRQPENSLLQATRPRLEEAIASRLTQQIVQLRAAGQYAQASRVVERARALLLQSLDADELQAELDTDQRAQEDLQAATLAAQAGQLDKAINIVQRGLTSAPQHRGLHLLERRLNTQWRLDSGAAALPQLGDGRAVTLELRQAPLSAALESLSRSSGINFVLDRDVRQDAPITMFVRNASPSDALDLVLGAQGLTRRVLDARTALIFANTPEKKKEHQEVVVRVFHLTHTDAKTVAAMLRSTLRSAEPFVDERANVVTLRDSADIVALAERLVALHDNPDPEVMLEVEVREVSRSRLQNLGINIPPTVTLTPLNAAKASTGLTLDDLRQISPTRIGAAVSPLTFNLKREVGEGQVLANPSIRTKNREKAKFLIGDKVPVVTTSSTATGIIGQNVTYLEVGLKLEVEPQISPDGDVTLKLALEVSNITKQVETGNGGTAYQIGTRNASTTLRLQDGETQFLGGLISKTDSGSGSRIPGIGDLPVLGRLLGNQQDNSAQTELVLSITPRILRSAFRPDPMQAVLSMGTENAPRLRQRGPLPQPKATGTPPGAAASPASGSTAGEAAALTTISGVAPTTPAQARLKADAQVQQGQAWTVTLEFESPAPFRALPLEMTYPAQAFDVLDVALSDELAQDGAIQLSHAVNSEQGKISANLLSTGPAGGVRKSATLQLRLRPKLPGKHSVRLTYLAPIGLQGPQSTVQPLPSLSVNVNAP